MFASRPVVHPMEVAAAPANPAQQQQPQGVLMKDLPGMPGTPSGLALRVTQFLLAAVSLAVMSSTSDFASVTAFWYPLPPGSRLLLRPAFATALRSPVACLEFWNCIVLWGGLFGGLQKGKPCDLLWCSASYLIEGSKRVFTFEV